MYLARKLFTKTLVFAFLLLSLPALALPTDLRGYIGNRCELSLLGENLSETEAYEKMLSSIKRFEDQGEIAFDEYQMVIPGKKARVVAKMAHSLVNVREQILKAHTEGKYILSLIGSFDLIHKGHASFVSFMADEYQRVTGVPRDKIFVLVMADDDDLISVGKSYKWVGNGGKEPFRRPIQKATNWESEYHPRLIDLASFPLDLTAMKPSPRTGRELFYLEDFKTAIRQQAQYLPEIAHELKLIPGLAAEEIASIEIVTQSAQKMIHLILNGQEQLLIDEFARSETNNNSEIWNLSAWDLVLNMYLTLGLEGQGGRLIRIINKRDGEYLMRVALASNMVGYDARFLQGASVSPTSDLLKKYGAETLLKAKQRAHKNF